MTIVGAEAGVTARRVPVGPWLFVVLLLTAMFVAFVFIASLVVSDVPARLGVDYRLYMDAARSWLDGEGFYPAAQLAGPYGIDSTPVLYPPVALVLFVPFVFLPAPLWWGVPLAIVTVVVWRHRPAPWAWPLLLLGFGWANSVWLVLAGNPVMWVAAAIAVATLHGWSGPLALLKPSVAPFALIGIRTRGWWMTLLVVLAASAAFLPMWPDYLTVLSNFKTDRGLLYSSGDWPLLGAIVVARLARRARPPAGDDGSNGPPPHTRTTARHDERDG